MAFIIDGLEPMIGEVSLNLRRRDIGMTQQFLHRSKVRSIIEHMSSKGVAQDMRRQGFGNMDLEPIIFNELPKALPRHARSPNGQEKIVTGTVFLDKMGTDPAEILL